MAVKVFEANQIVVQSALQPQVKQEDMGNEVMAAQPGGGEVNCLIGGILRVGKVLASDVGSMAMLPPSVWLICHLVSRPRFFIIPMLLPMLLMTMLS